MKWLKAHHTEILIFALFIFLSLVVTYPLIFKLKSHIYGYPSDSLGTIWKFWWLKYSIWEKHIPPFYCPLIAAPQGFNLRSFPQIGFYFYLVPLILFVLNEIVTYNLILLLSFFLSAITMYLLVHRFTKSKPASMLSGIIYAFSPYHMVHATQHLSLVSIQWMPLYLLTLFNLSERPNYRNAIFCSLSFALVFFFDYYYGYFILILTGVFILYQLWSIWVKRGKLKNLESPAKTFRIILVTISLSFLFILPFSYSYFNPKREVFTSLKRVSSSEELFTYAAYPLNYLLPSKDNPILGRYTANLIKNPLYGGHPVEHTLYLGWVGIVLSIVAIREWRRKNKLVNKLTSRQVDKSKRSQKIEDRNWQTGKPANWSIKTQKGVSFFLFAAIVALLFSHSPYTEIGIVKILFPSYFMYKIAPMFRVYARFGIVVILCVSVLAGIGLTTILEKIKNAKKRKIFLTIVLLPIFIEFAPTLPAPMINAVNPPPVYEWLAEEEGDFIIAEYPIETDYEYLFWQRIHRKRLINGAFSGALKSETKGSIANISDSKTPGILSQLGVRYVILHPEKYLESKEVEIIGLIPDLEKEPSPRLVKTFPKARVYEIPPKGLSGKRRE